MVERVVVVAFARCGIDYVHTCMVSAVNPVILAK
jgi:hypothetical protein